MKINKDLLSAKVGNIARERKIRLHCQNKNFQNTEINTFKTPKQILSKHRIWIVI